MSATEDRAQRVLAELRDNDEYGWAEAIALIEHLMVWRDEALKALSGWDQVYAALDPQDAPIGELRSSIALRAVRDLKAKIIELEEAIRLHRTRTTGYINAQPTPEPIALTDEDLYAVIKEQKQ